MKKTDNQTPQAKDEARQEACEEKGSETIFSNGLDGPEDLLVNAAAVTKFLSDLSIYSGTPDFLSKDGAHGLYLILTGLENTIQAALERM